jgi:hypothetical protein
MLFFKQSMKVRFTIALLAILLLHSAAAATRTPNADDAVLAAWDAYRAGNAVKLARVTAQASVVPVTRGRSSQNNCAPIGSGCWARMGNGRCFASNVRLYSPRTPRSPAMGCSNAGVPTIVLLSTR